MQFFYDGQIRRYIAQIVRMLSNFKYRTADGQEKIVPVVYGDPTSQVANIIKDNSENKLPSTPRIAVYVTGLELDRSRLSDATYTNKLHIRERNVNDDTNQYEALPGRGYTVERLMPTPYSLAIKADIWTSNVTQKLQILEQILVLFNPSFEIQTTDNYVDWTSLSVVELTNVVFSNRTIGSGQDEIDIASLEFETPIFITPPAKVTRLGVIHTIITNIFTEDTGTIDPTFIFGDPDSVQYITPGNYGLLVINNEARLLNSGESVSDAEVPDKYGLDVNWYKLLDQFGNFRAGVSRIYLKKADETEIVGVMSVNPSDENVVLVNWDPDTYPTNTIIAGRGTIDAIINPLTYRPQQPLATGLRYLLLEDIGADENNDGAQAWKNLDATDFVAKANDIVEWDGAKWNIVFSSASEDNTTYITNLRTGIQYKWDGTEWTKSFEGVYPAGRWRLQL